MAPISLTKVTHTEMSSAQYPWQARGGTGGGMDAGQSSAVVFASYPVLLLLVILSAFVKHVWIALALYCALMILLSCTSRCFLRPEASAAAAGRGGLSQAAIAAIPAFLYDACACAGAGDAEADCAVCLEALRDGEKVRRLPVCAHTFHVGCVEMLLDSHATCPVSWCHVEPRKSGKLMPLPPEPPLPPV